MEQNSVNNPNKIDARGLFSGQQPIQGARPAELELSPSKEMSESQNKSVGPVDEKSAKPVDLTQQLCEEIAAKTKKYDANMDQDGEAEFDSTETIGWWSMIARERSSTDCIKLMIGAFAATCIGAALPAFCLVFGEMIDGVAGTGSSDGDEGEFNALQKQSLIMIYIGAGLFFAGMTQVAMLTQFGENISFKTQITYFKRALEMDSYYYEEQNPTEMASKIAKEIAALKRGTGNKVGSAIMAIASFILGIAFSFYWGWLMNVILLGFVPVILFLGMLMASALQSGLTESLKAYSQSAGYAEQALQAIKIVHTYGQEKLEEKNYKKYLNRCEELGAKTNIKGAFGFAGVMTGLVFFYAYSFYFGGWLRWNDIKNFDGREYSGGVIISIMFSTVFGAVTGGTMAPHAKAIAESQIAGKLAYDTIDHVPKIKSSEKGTKVLNRKEMQGLYEFKNVEFTYPSRPDNKILKKFSCVFEAGKTTALVGPSGSGKSTIIQLLERFYDPTGGEILLDGDDIKQVNLKSMRQLIGYVGQEPVLFNASIKENMLFAQPDATDDEIIQALKDANAWSFIQKKMGATGINTQVGGSGGQLSGGQKQRIAIARAFLKQPKIILLDEATSALDKMNEKAIQDAIDNYRTRIGNITTIVIAHRLSTIKDADKIVVMKSGELVEMGNHQTLLEQYPDGVYAGFCKKQESANTHNNGENTETRAKEDDEEIDVKQINLQDATMKEKADKADALYKEEIDKLEEENKKISGYTKLQPYNKPVKLIVVATLGAIVNGSAQPILGVIFAKILGLLSAPKEYLALQFGEDHLQEEVTKYVIFLIGLAFVNGIAIVFQKYSFGYLGNKVTQRVREVLYVNILQKNIGWFDERDNGPSVLTSILSADAAAINGVGGESIGPTAESVFGMIIGIGVGFYYCPLQATVCLLVSPIMVIGATIDMQMMKAAEEDNKDALKEANLLCGDSIVNYKTVQSFGHEDKLVEKYKELLMPVHKVSMSKGLKSGAAFGCSQFSQYVMFATMFFFGGLIIKNSVDEETGEVKTSAEDVFIALFAIMFGANAAGNAASFGPDMEKAETAAQKIFRVIELPSTINAVEMDEGNKDKKKRIDIENVKGAIEFKDVWFRYPTRKEDFVMQGFSIKINPNENIALVGESGCGKSTFVNLLMRFYDIDSGKILLDGVNINDYNLHDLRNVISLVMQEPTVFNYSILENLLYGKLDATNSEIYNATTVANANEFIEGNGQISDKAEESTATELIKKMEANQSEIKASIGKKKYDEEMEVLKKIQEQEKNKGQFVTVQGDVDTRDSSLKDIELHEGFQITCGNKGNKLSGGQKQRVAIARTMIKQPKILLLDEATSALDEDSQKKVQGALENAMKGRTTIIIAHRMSTIEKCDKIFVLETGKVIEEGGFQELKNKDGGFFSNLAQGKQQ